MQRKWRGERSVGWKDDKETERRYNEDRKQVERRGEDRDRIERR